MLGGLGVRRGITKMSRNLSPKRQISRLLCGPKTALAALRPPSRPAGHHHYICGRHGHPPYPRKVMVPPSLLVVGVAGWPEGRGPSPCGWGSRLAGLRPAGPHGPPRANGPMKVCGLIFCRPDYMVENTIGGAAGPGSGCI